MAGGYRGHCHTGVRDNRPWGCGDGGGRARDTRPRGYGCHQRRRTWGHAATGTWGRWREGEGHPATRVQVSLVHEGDSHPATRGRGH